MDLALGQGSVKRAIDEGYDPAHERDPLLRHDLRSGEADADPGPEVPGLQRAVEAGGPGPAAPAARRLPGPADRLQGGAGIVQERHPPWTRRGDELSRCC